MLPASTSASQGFGDDEIAKLLKSLESRERRDRPEGFDFEAAWDEATKRPVVRRDVLDALGHRVLDLVRGHPETALAVAANVVVVPRPEPAGSRPAQH